MATVKKIKMVREVAPVVETLDTLEYAIELLCASVVMTTGDEIGDTEIKRDDIFQLFVGVANKEGKPLPTLAAAIELLMHAFEINTDDEIKSFTVSERQNTPDQVRVVVTLLTRKEQLSGIDIQS